MRYTYKAKWRNGEITIEAECVEDLKSALQKIEEEAPIFKAREPFEAPEIPGTLGCRDAIRGALRSAWGKSEPRTMKEIDEVLKVNALYFEEGTLSGALSGMTKAGELRRIKKGDVWAYILPAGSSP